MKSPGFTATIRGEIAYISQCHPVSVNYSALEGHCYNELPVLYNGRKLFLSPRNHILIETGTEIDCSTILQVGYKIDNTWFGVNMGAIFLLRAASFDVAYVPTPSPRGESRTTSRFFSAANGALASVVRLRTTRARGVTSPSGLFYDRH